MWAQLYDDVALSFQIVVAPIGPAGVGNPYVALSVDMDPMGKVNLHQRR